MAGAALLDVTGDVCPMTLVRVRIAMDRIGPRDTLKIRMASGEPIASVPRTLRDEGHEILAVERVGGDAFEVTVRKKA